MKTNPMKRYYIFFAALVAVCALAITSNALLRRGPVHDASTANDLRLIKDAVDNYYLSQGKLPSTLSQAQVPNRGLKGDLKSYEYALDNEDTYRLCAVFMTEQHPRYGYTAPSVADPDDHAKGYQCFRYTVSPIYGEPFKG